MVLRGIYMTTHVSYYTGGRTLLHSVSPVRSISCCHIHVVSGNSIPAYYLLRMLPMYGAVSHAHIDSIPPSPNYWVCPGTDLWPTFFVYYMRWSSRSYTCTSYHTFRSSFGRTAKFKYGRSVFAAERPNLIPTSFCLWLFLEYVWKTLPWSVCLVW